MDPFKLVNEVVRATMQQVITIVQAGCYVSLDQCTYSSLCGVVANCVKDVKLIAGFIVG